ncbi:MAG: TMEM175 family protein [Ginsengibacter sp.]
MQAPKHDKEKQDFQLERFIFFSDGVFAISITLLIIEIKIPYIPNPTDLFLWHSLSEMALRFLGFIISFGIVGHYWSVHHRIFGYVAKYSSSLIWLNLAFLLTVVMLPFSAGLLGEYSSNTNLKIPYAVYAFNMSLTGFMNYWLWVYVSGSGRHMLTRDLSKARIKLGVYRSLVIPVIFIISLLVSFILPIISRIILLLIPVILHWGMKTLEKRAERDESGSHKVTPGSDAAHANEPQINQ